MRLRSLPTSLALYTSWMAAAFGKVIDGERERLANKRENPFVATNQKNWGFV